ncbi:MAG: hypothetical protein LBR39_01545 [Coriobacteriales bacterium]|jgi:hypothetical protein|nr:hypothetical protein [Coriobacteriales bacterium]
MTPDKYDAAARITVNMVAEELSVRHGWSLNEALSRMTKADLYPSLTSSSTKLWMENPLDLADLFDKEFVGDELTIANFFYGVPAN